MVAALISDGMGNRSTDAPCCELRDVLGPLVRGCTDFGNNVKTKSSAVGLLTPGLPVSNRSSVPLQPRWSHSQRWNRMSAPSLHACARSKHMQPLLQAFLVRQGRGPSPAKQVPHLLDSYLTREPSAKNVWQDTGYDGSPYAVDSPCCNTRCTILVRQSKSQEEREIGRRFKPLWEALVTRNFHRQGCQR